MILKKFYGNSIKEAREKATSQLGPDCIVLESREASGDDEACVTVMVDHKKEKVLQKPAGKQAGETRQRYSRSDLIPKSLDKMKKAISEGMNPGSSGEPAESDSGAAEEPSREPKPEREPSLLDTRTGNGRQEEQEFQRSFAENMKKSSVSHEVTALHRRFDHMEQLLSDAMISANLEYVSHPAYQQLLNTGMKATTISIWFKKIINKGIDPYEQNQSFMYELAQIIRSALSFAIPEAPVKNLLFVGPSGAGKSSLIMKLVTHPDYMLNKSVAIVSVEPDRDQPVYSPLKPFAKDQKVPFYCIRSGVEMSALESDLEEFDHVLFDTPSISLQQEAAFRSFWKIRQLLSSIAPLEIHYTVNATLERYYFKESYVTNHPLQPDYVAITHLDETDKWGHLIPFLQTIGASVRYISQGPHRPDHLYTYKPEWFADNILSES